MIGYTARDVDCAFKLFPRRLLDDVHLESTGHTLSPELLIKARRAGYRIAEVRVTHLPRTAGQAKGARVDHIVRSLLELVRLRLDVGRGVRRGEAALTPSPGMTSPPTPHPRQGEGAMGIQDVGPAGREYRAAHDIAADVRAAQRPHGRVGGG